jgi:hypothetical protein
MQQSFQITYLRQDLGSHQRRTRLFGQCEMVWGTSPASKIGKNEVEASSAIDSRDE